MKRFLGAVLALALAAGSVSAQDRNGLFTDEPELMAFVEDHAKKRDFATLLRELGGADEFTDPQIAGVQSQFLNVYPRDFTDMALVKTRQLESGFSQRVYAFWTGDSYVWLYLFLHAKGEGVQVLHFAFNSDMAEIVGMIF